MENKDFILDDPTGIDNYEKEYFCTFLSKNIGNVYNGDQWTTVSEDITNVNPKEVDEYIMSFRYSQNLPIKNIKVDSVTIEDKNVIADIRNHTNTFPKGLLPVAPQMLYFIEGGESAIVIIPVFIDKNNLRIYLELLDSSSQIIKDYYFDKNDKKSLKGIKFIKASDLKNNKRK